MKTIFIYFGSGAPPSIQASRAEPGRGQSSWNYQWTWSRWEWKGFIILTFFTSSTSLISSSPSLSSLSSPWRWSGLSLLHVWPRWWRGKRRRQPIGSASGFFTSSFSSKTGSASEFFLLSFLQLIQGVQQRWWGLYTCWRDEVCLESGNLCLYLPPLHQSHDDLGVLHGGGGGDVGGGRQERGWGDQLLGVQMHDGGKPNSLVAPAIYSPTVGNLKKVFTIKDEQEKKWKLWWGRIPFPWNSSDAMSSGNYQRMNRVSAVLR